MTAQIPDLSPLRSQFPGLQELDERGNPFVFFDGPAGTQVPQAVIEAVTDYYHHSNACKGGRFITSQRSTEVVEAARRAMADFLPTITIKAKDFANEITNFSIKRDYLHTEAQITREHIKNNRDVRKLLQKRRILPEELPAAEDVKKIERRLTTEEKKLPKQTKLLEPPGLEQQLIFDNASKPPA